MQAVPNAPSMAPDALADEEIVRRVRAGERTLFELLMRRHNRRVFRTARSIVRTDEEAEDVMQEAYFRAYEHLAQFSGESGFAAWLTSIAAHEALARVRGSARLTLVAPEDAMNAQPESRDLERRLVSRDLLRLIESSVDRLPEEFRTVFVLRQVEGLSTEEVAASLSIKEETVKTRLHRARQRLREAMAEQLEEGASEAFSFHLSRCDRVVAAVMSRIR